MIGATIKGLDSLVKNMERRSKEYSDKIAKAEIKGGQIVRTSAIKSIQGKSSGEIVTRSRSGGGVYTHIESKPGDAPNTDTGRLVQSVQVEVKKDGVYVGSSLKYAPALEFGTKYMDARPWLNPALESSRNDIKKIMIAAIKGVK